MPTISCVCIITFTFYSSRFFLQTTFTLTQVVLRAIIFTFTQVPKKATHLNTANALYHMDYNYTGVLWNIQRRLQHLQNINFNTQN